MPEPEVSAIVPARNEEANIAGVVETLAAQTVPVEIIVVNDGSTDRTGAILEELAGQIPQLRVVENPELAEGWTGKSYAVTRGVEQSGTAWLLFTDADVRHHPDAVERGLAVARKTGAAMVSVSPEQEMRSWWERATIPFVHVRLASEYPYERVSNPEDPLAAANGQWLLVSRVAYDAVGGHAASKEEILEDMALARRLKRSGCRLYFAPGSAFARTHMYRSLREMMQGWSKNLFLLFDQRKGAVVGAMVGAAFDSLVWLLLLVALWGVWQGWPVSRLILAFLLGLVGFRHVRYLLQLRRIQFPLWCVFYYTLGSVLFAGLLLESASRYLSGERLRWKGRDYALPTK